ncbi:ComF family protein [Jiangella alba]|uniref:Phosphoribosyltransferase domain-containing protein n=1 Tax=Jiangella alba TaxID=561176 RepID=A0A1H5HC48_9ACTN|nr:phosphoribosyltransferase family protein [Jiangella alba]SEE25549.1 hypothetical protein SAMN04488561_0813 [Jiangella alba]
MIIYSRITAHTSQPESHARAATRPSHPESAADATARTSRAEAAARTNRADAAARTNRADAAARNNRAEAPEHATAAATRSGRPGSTARAATQTLHVVARAGPSRPAGPRRAGVRPALVRLRHTVARLGHAAADLALGSTCAGCGEHAGLLCPPCRAALLGSAARLRTVPGRPDLPLAGAAAYADAVGAAIIDHKERGRLPLAKPLGDALAVAITATTDHLAAPIPDRAIHGAAPALDRATHGAIRLAAPTPSRAIHAAAHGAPYLAAPTVDHAIHGAATHARATHARATHLAAPTLDPAVLATTASGHATHGDRPIVLIPVPSAPSAVRHRGHDPVLRTARRAAATLQRSGQAATVVPCLRHGRRVADQAGLDRHEREHNLYGSLVATAAATRRTTGCCVVIVDDVMTTGATLRESARALEAAGLRPCAAAVIAVV